MSKGRKLKGAAVVAVMFASSLFFGDVAHASRKSGTWKPSTGLSGMSPGAFSTACREIYEGKPEYETGLWTCEMSDGRLVACSVEDTTSTNCRTYTPPAKSSFTSAGRPASSGPTTFSR